jgi:hypothetical protein
MLANLRNVHEANIQNSAQFHATALAEWQNTQPQIQDVSKDGALVSQVKNGKRTISWQKFSNAKEPVHLNKIKEAYGEQSPTYQMSLFHDLVESKDTLGLMRQIAQDSLKGGYASEVLGADVVEQAKEEAMESLTAMPSDKDYSEKLEQAIANKLIRHVNLSDKEMLQRLQLNGNVFGTYLLGGSK